jgi:multimeric flavodoxin WrbA
MKILIVNGSNRIHGNTDQLIGLIGENLRAEAAKAGQEMELEVIHPGKMHLEFCRGCRICYDRGEDACPVGDDMLAIKARMQAADGVLLASPVYVDDVSAAMKNYIDRLCHLCHRPEFADKIGYVLATTGSSRASKTLETMGMSLRLWGFYVAGQKGVTMGARMKPDEVREKLDSLAGEIAKKLFDAIQGKAYLNPTFLSLLTFKIQQLAWSNKAQPGTVDYEHWRSHGWLDGRRTFYIEHKANPLKVGLARMCGALLAPFGS